MDLDRHIGERLGTLVPGDASLCVGLSGGLDSVVLLDLLARNAGDRRVCALHAHHGLSPNPDAWAQFCRELCAERGVPLAIERLRIDPAARFARHAAAADALLEALARLDGLPENPGTDLVADPRLPEARRANLLRAFLALNALAMPSEARLADMTRQLFGTRGDARVRIEHDGLAVVKFRDRGPLEEIAPEAGARHDPWHGELEVDL